MSYLGTTDLLSPEMRSYYSAQVANPMSGDYAAAMQALAADAAAQKTEAESSGWLPNILKGLLTAGVAALPTILGTKPVIPPEIVVPKYVPPVVETPWYMRTTTMIAVLLGGAVGLVLLARRAPAYSYSRRRR